MNVKSTTDQIASFISNTIDVTHIDHTRPVEWCAGMMVNALMAKLGCSMEVADMMADGLLSNIDDDQLSQALDSDAYEDYQHEIAMDLDFSIPSAARRSAKLGGRR
jgi:hypothetical protein